MASDRQLLETAVGLLRRFKRYPCEETGVGRFGQDMCPTTPPCRACAARALLARWDAYEASREDVDWAERAALARGRALEEAVAAIEADATAGDAAWAHARAYFANVVRALKTSPPATPDVTGAITTHVLRGNAGGCVDWCPGCHERRSSPRKAGE